VNRSTSTSYRASEDTTREKEIGVLVSIFRLALDSANKNAAGVSSTNGDNAERDLSDSAGDIIRDTK
jgi:hypothetical protein